jgi:hypothetical protein
MTGAADHLLTGIAQLLDSIINQAYAVRIKWQATGLTSAQRRTVQYCGEKRLQP